MAVPFSNTKLRVPKGFQNILEGLAREVLRNQPENPFEFGAKYFEQLLKVREETGHDPAIHGARLEDRFYNNDSFKSPSVDANSPQQQDAALKIQTQYRKHDAEKKVAEMREDEAAEKIQAGFRGFQDRQKYAEMKRQKESSDKERGGEKEEEEVDIDLNDPDVEKAAVKIQAGFKGFKARQEIKEIKESKQTEKVEEKKTDEEEADIDLNDPEVEKAALKIQAGFKGMQARQEIKAMKDARDQETEKKDTKEEDKKQEEVDIDLNDPETEKAALKIQAGFKGYQTRKEIKAKKEEKAEETKEEKKDEVDIDLNDPEVEKAATKIQAGFKGFKTRQEIKAKKESGTDVKEGEKAEQSEEKTGEEKPAENAKGEKIDIDLNDPEVAQAATKIQAGFKGFKTRQEIKQKKAEEKKDGE